MSANWDGYLWLLLLLGPLLILQRSLHQNIQAVFLLITKRTEISLILYSLVFLPGVLIHELSHFVVARILGVRTGRFSLIPRAMPTGKLQLGYVETAKTDILRDTIIGAAPLVAGGLLVSYIGLNRLGFTTVWESIKSMEVANVWAALVQISDQQDFWLWFYLTFVVSSTMLPSVSDRRAWPSVILALFLLLVIAFIIGAGQWMADTISPLINKALLSLDVALGISVFLHIILLPILWVSRKLLEKMTGLRVE